MSGAHADGRRSKCRSSRLIQSRRIKLSLVLPSPGVVVDRHDLRQLGCQLYARLLLLDIADQVAKATRPGCHGNETQGSLSLDERVPPRGNHGLAVRRIKLSLALPAPGVVDDRHDLTQIGSQLYARLLLLDIAVLMQEIPGLTVRRDDIQLRASRTMSMSFLRRAMSARLLISPTTSSAPRFADVPRRLDAADVAHASVAAWRSLKLGDLEANDRPPVLRRGSA